MSRKMFPRSNAHTRKIFPVISPRIARRESKPRGTQRGHRKNGYQSHRLAARYGLRFFGAQFTHHHQLHVNQGAFNALTARAQLRRRLGDWTPHLSVDYRMMPQPRLRNAQAGLDRNLRRHLKATASLNLHNLVHARLVAKAGIQGELGDVRWGLNAGWGQRGGWALGASLAMGIGPDPVDGGLMISSPDLTSRGAVVADIFRDTNGNGIRDPDEEPIEGARVQGYGKRSYREETGPSGRVRVDSNPSHYTELRLDTGSLDDPFALSTVPGRSITTRPGAVAILKLPVVIAGEVDGTLYVDRAGQHVPLAGGCVTLRPRERAGKITPPPMEARTAYDGFFDFPHVPPGSYELGVCRPRSRNANFVRPAPQPIFVGLDGTVITDRQIVIASPPKSVSSSLYNGFARPELHPVAAIETGRTGEMSHDHRAVEAERRAAIRARSQDKSTSRVRMDNTPTPQLVSR